MEYGKFNTAEELLKGYTELEKSFTQKCQELAALKQNMEQSSNTNEQNDANCGTNEQSSPHGKGGTSESSPQSNSAQSTAEETKATVPAPENADGFSTESHAEVITVTPPRVMTGGGNVSMALPNRPKTLAEASELAKKYFN